VVVGSEARQLHARVAERAPPHNTHKETSAI
jgi:hypothetical protein